MKCELVLLVGLMLSGCAQSSGGGGGGSTAASKALFSKWSEVGDSTTYMDMTGHSFNSTSALDWVFPGGVCTANVLVMGDESAGQVVVTNAVISSGADPGCAAILNGIHSYTKSGAQLTVCKSTCFTYE